MVRRAAFIVSLATAASMGSAFVPSIGKVRPSTVMRAEKNDFNLGKAAKALAWPFVLVPFLTGTASTSAMESYNARSETVQVAAANIADKVVGQAKDAVSGVEELKNKGAEVASGAKEWVGQNDQAINKKPTGFWDRLVGQNKKPKLADTEEAAKSAVQKKSPFNLSPGQDQVATTTGKVGRGQNDGGFPNDATGTAGSKKASDGDVAINAKSNDIKEPSGALGAVQGLKSKDIKRLDQQEKGDGFGKAKSPSEGLTSKDVGQVGADGQWQNVKDLTKQGGKTR